VVLVNFDGVGQETLSGSNCSRAFHPQRKLITQYMTNQGSRVHKRGVKERLIQPSEGKGYKESKSYGLQRPYILIVNVGNYPLGRSPCMNFTQRACGLSKTQRRSHSQDSTPKGFNQLSSNRI